MPTNEPALPSPLPSFGPAPAALDAPPRPRIRLAAIVGAVASFAWCIAFFLPWISFPQVERERIHQALAPEVEALSRGRSDHAERYRILLSTIVEDGGLGGLDLFHYARSALALNEDLVGPEPAGKSTERPWVIRRLLRTAAWVLAGLPLLSLMLGLHFTLHAFRRARAPVLILCVVVGCAGGALALTWLRFAESISAGARTAFGIRVALVAGVAQACVGLFGVTTRNWWVVFLGASVTLFGVGSLLSAYVARGALP